MTLDIATLFVVTVFSLGLGGLLLLFSWLQNRNTRALVWWGMAFIVFAPATALIGGRGAIADGWSIQVANSLLLLGYGLLWTGARVFEGRKPVLRLTLAGAIGWLVACQFDPFFQSVTARITLASSLIWLYAFLFIAELWRGRQERLLSRWPAMGLVGLHAILFPLRAPLAVAIPVPLSAMPPSSVSTTVVIFAPLFYAFALVFLLMALTKERAESSQRYAATIDPLTGISNRRGFNERAERVVTRFRPDNAPLTLLLFDLDNFKHVNDRFGHRAGDQVLVLFAHTLSQALRPLDLVGRIGGEEFVALLPGVRPEAVRDVAERVRDAFSASAREIDGQLVGATVSIGTATTPQAGYHFDSLYAVADAALYRAKKKGRNRIELGLPFADHPLTRREAMRAVN